MPGYVYKGSDFSIPTIDKQPKAWVESPKRPRKKPLAPFDPTLCGTIKGYRQHRDHQVARCRDCLDIYNEYQRGYRAGVRIQEKRFIDNGR